MDVIGIIHKYIVKSKLSKNIKDYHIIKFKEGAISLGTLTDMESTLKIDNFMEFYHDRYIVIPKIDKKDEYLEFIIKFSDHIEADF